MKTHSSGNLMNYIVRNKKSMQQMKYEKSCGAVVFARIDGKIKYSHLVHTHIWTQGLRREKHLKAGWGPALASFYGSCRALTSVPDWK